MHESEDFVTSIQLKEIGDRLRKTRKALKLKQEDYSQEVKFTTTSISDYENGKKKPHFDFLFNLSREFNVNLNYILLGEGEMFRNTAEMFQPGEGGVAPFGDLTPGIMKIIDTMKISPFARAGIYTMVLEFLYKQKELIQKDIDNAAARSSGSIDSSSLGGGGA